MKLYCAGQLVFCFLSDRDHYSELPRYARFRPFSEPLIQKQTARGQRRLAMDVITTRDIWTP